MRPKTPLRHKITLALFGLFLFLVLLEMGLRLGGFIYVTLQENRNRASLRRGGEFRILCLGDSMTASGQDPYPQQLEEILNERDIGIEFSVINKAVPSTTSSMILLQLENNILKYKPQMVLAMMGINDEGEHMLYAQAPSSRLFSWMRYSRAYKLTRLIWLRLAAKIKEYLPPIRVNLGLERCYAQEANGVNSKSETQYVELGKAYVRQGNYTQAEETIKKALEINPRSDSAYVELAWCYNRQGEFSRAEDAFKKALEVNPRNDNAYLWRGRMYSGSFNNNIQAVIFFKRAIEINPTNADACIELAGIYVTEGKYIQAKDLLSKSLAQHPEDERTQRALGVLNAQINNRDSGKELPDSIIDKSAQSYKIMTRQSYLKLKEVLDSRGIQLVCVQYPMRSIRALKNIFEWQEGAIFVDNERVFKEALKEAPYEQYFIDMFAGDFGHCTHKGNRLLAENIANVIAKEYFQLE